MTEEFNASLVREKVVFVDAPMEGALDHSTSTVIRSNRIFLKLKSGTSTEKVVVRAQNMHATLRLAGRILSSYHRDGALLERAVPFDWQGQWDQVLSDYEREYNPDIWAAVYINGRPAFKTTTSPLVDVIEQCALLTLDDYDATMGVTENALRQIGRAMRISHSSNVAAVFDDNGSAMRCGVIHRARGKGATFSFTAGRGTAPDRVMRSFGLTAAFLEGLNLRFLVDSLRVKMKKTPIAKELMQIKAGDARLEELNKDIVAFEKLHEFKYRPEKPRFYGAA